jgi:hypothetical protein
MYGAKMSDTENKIVMLDWQGDFLKTDSYSLNMVRKLLEDNEPSLPLIKISDSHPKVGEFPPHCLMGKAKSHTVKNIVKDI